MMHYTRVVIIAFCALTLFLNTNAQTPPVKDASRQIEKSPARKSGRNALESADPLVQQRRAMAFSLITSLADEARSFRDDRLRARVQMRAADVLWEVDKDRSRAYFRRAWEAAETADNESLRRFEEERRAQLARSGSFAGSSPSNLRGEVLRLATRRDPALGEEFLAKLTEGAEKDAPSVAGAGDNTPNRISPDPENPPPAVAQRLRLARQLLEEGDVARALQFADKAFDQVTTDGIHFLSALREKDAPAANQRYGALLARAAVDPLSDAVTVSVLSSYAFTPFLHVIVTRQGNNHTSRQREQIDAPDLPVALRAAFFRAAAQILTRPILPPDQDRTLAGRGGTYFVIARLLPLFEQYAPELVAEVGAQMAALTADAPERFRDGSKDPMLTRGLVPEEVMLDEGGEALDRIDRAPNQEARDDLYARAAPVAARKGEARAGDLADKIEDSDLRKRVRSFVDFTLLNKALERKEAAEALRLARTGDLSNIHRAWALTEIARLMQKSDPARTVEVLDSAAAEARRIGGGDPDRARALVAVATRTYELDHPRVWDAVLEAVKAANAASEFTGEDGQIVASLRTRSGTSTTSSSVESFNLTGIFGLLARDDLYRTIDLAKSLFYEAPRAAATLAVVRAVLDRKPTARNERRAVTRN